MAADVRPDDRAASGFRAAWAVRPWRRLLASVAISSIGDWLYFTAFSVWLYDETGSVAWLGAAAFLRLLPYVLLGTAGGVVAERVARRPLLVGLDLARGGLIGLLAVVAAFDGPPAVALAVAVAASVLTVPYRSAMVAATPDLVGERALAGANAAEAIVGQLSVFVGPAAAAFLLTAGSAELAIGLNAVTFAGSAMLLAGLPLASGRDPGDVMGADRAAGPPEVSGWRVIRRTPGLLTLTGLITVSLFVFGAEGILQLLVAEDRLGRGADFVGVLVAAVGIGGLLASPFAARVASSDRPGIWLISCAVLSGAPLVVLGLTRSTTVALIALLFEGVGVILFEVLSLTLVQRLSGDSLARVYGTQDAAGAGAQLAGAAMVPVLVNGLSLELACIVSGGVLVGFGVLGAPSLLRCGVRSAQIADELEPVVDVLRTIGLFEGTTPAGLEVVAANVSPCSVRPGEEILTEGAPADDLYIIRSGVFRASTLAEGHLRDMSAGDWFGEIGLLLRRPRTATVTAASDGMLWRVPGPVFVHAVEGLALLPTPLRRGMQLRIAATPGSIDEEMLT